MKTDAPTRKTTRAETAAEPASHGQLRDQVASEMEAFLRAGGRVQEVERGKRADPPRPPKGHYGSRPI